MGTYIEISEVETPSRLNNFFCNFKCPKSTKYPRGYHRTSHARFETITFAEIARVVEDSEAGVVEYYASRSDKKLKQTPIQFFNEIDLTAQEAGVDISVVGDFIFEYIQHLEREDMNQARISRSKLDTYIFPVYLALRRKGYNPIDLT